MRRASLGGHAGAGVNRASHESGSSRPGDDLETTLWSLQTFTAAIQVQLYL